MRRDKKNGLGPKGRLTKWITPFILGFLCLSMGTSCEEEKVEEEVVEEKAFYYVGRAYDGATGQRLTEYRVRLIYADKDLEGEIDSEGRYYVGPLEAGHDFTIEIEADNYRSFMSHNPMNLEIEDVRSFYFDAYLFPYEMPTPKTYFYISITDADELPTGLYRLRPVGASSLYEGDVQRPAAVVDGESGTQRWENDEDLQFQTLFGEFSDGEFSIQAEKLVYGVTYEIVIFGVNGYQEYRHVLRAGMDGDQAYQLDPLNEQTLALSFVSTDLGIFLEEAKVVFVFNQPIELDPLLNATEMLEAFNTAFSIETSDDDEDGEMNVLAELRRGVSFTISENRLLISWDPTVGLETTDEDDVISKVTFDNLGLILLRPEGGIASTTQSLSGLLGQNAVDVDLIQ